MLRARALEKVRITVSSSTQSALDNQSGLPSVALRAFSDLSLVASLYLEWLIGMEVSIANRSHSSQARRDSSRMNPISPRSYVGGNKKTGLSLRLALKMPIRKRNWWILLRCLAEAHWLEDDAQHHGHAFLLN